MKEKETAYWDWQVNGTHFCSECGHDVLYRRVGYDIYEEECTCVCPYCGRVMTEIREEDEI